MSRGSVYIQQKQTNIKKYNFKNIIEKKKNNMS